MSYCYNKIYIFMFIKRKKAILIFLNMHLYGIWVAYILCTWDTLRPSNKSN